MVNKQTGIKIMGIIRISFGLLAGPASRFHRDGMISDAFSKIQDAFYRPA